jgi:hypothetical protein
MNNKGDIKAHNLIEDEADNNIESCKELNCQYFVIIVTKPPTIVNKNENYKQPKSKNLREYNAYDFSS